MSSITRDEHSNLRQAFFLPHLTIKNGVKTIEEILAKNVLCQHDGEDILRIYREVDLLERDVEKIPEELNSRHALQKIIEKVVKSVNAEGLISLYHLQKCSDLGLPVKQCFTNLLSDLSKDPYTTIEIATHLPHCSSEAQFNEDVIALIGPNSNKVIHSILNRKRDELQKRETFKRTAATKSELEEFRKKDPQNYPPYLDELIDSGHLDLYDHLIKMGTLSTHEIRKSTIKDIPFSLLSQIVLQTRKAVMEKVKTSIPANHRNILFLLGNTGAGKSTTLCFLRGDKMVAKGSCYETEDKNNGLIGHSEDRSCTFLPTIEIVNDWAIVDFPGFNDTNGLIVSLGIELALKALINMYTPKILILETINYQSRSKEVGKLGSMLTRLLDNKRDCVLGITKYSENFDFITIKNIEEQQKKERPAPTSKESELLIEIKTLSNLNMPSLQPIIEGKQLELAKIQQEKKQQNELPLPETTEKKQSRSKIEEKEAQLKKQIGCNIAISLSDLENQERLPSCFKILSEMKAIHANSKYVLDSEHEIKSLLDNRIEDLKKKISSKESHHNEFKDVRSFQISVLESSLINTILPQSPEAELLHLPEVDPNIVRKYSKEIVQDYMKKYIEGIIGTLNISPMIKALKEMGPNASAATVKDLEDKLLRLKRYILGLLGVRVLPLSLDPEKIEEEWVHIQKAQQAKAWKGWYMLPPWVMNLLSLPAKTSSRILEFINPFNATQEAANNAIRVCCNELDEMYDVLSILKVIEKVIAKQDDIEKAFYSGETDMSSVDNLLASLKNKIKSVKSVYESEEWDRRVSILKDQLFLRDPQSQPLACIPHILTGIISSLLDDNIQPILYHFSVCYHSVKQPMFRVNIMFIKKGMQNLMCTTIEKPSYSSFKEMGMRMEMIETHLSLDILGKGFLNSLSSLVETEAFKKITFKEEANIEEIVIKASTMLLEQANQLDSPRPSSMDVENRHVFHNWANPHKAYCLLGNWAEQRYYFWPDLRVNEWADIIKSPLLSSYIQIDAAARDLSRPLFRALLADALLQKMHIEKL